VAALGHWLSAIGSALVAMASGIGLNNGLVAVMAGCIDLAHWSAPWLQWPAALAVTMA